MALGLQRFTDQILCHLNARILWHAVLVRQKLWATRAFL